MKAHVHEFMNDGECETCGVMIGEYVDELEQEVGRLQRLIAESPRGWTGTLNGEMETIAWTEEGAIAMLDLTEDGEKQAARQVALVPVPKPVEEGA